MNLIEVLKRINRLRHLIIYFQNWPELIHPALKGNALRKVVLKNGIKIEAPKNHPFFEIVQEIFFLSAYTPAGIDIKPTDVVVDIGANIGIFSLFASSKTTGIIHAIEPFPDNFNYLKKNIESNQLHNVKLYNCAISDNIGMEKLFISESSGGHLLFDIDKRGSESRYIEVITTTLEQLMDENSISEIDFLKIDCEGAEGQLIQSTPKHCLARVKTIAMEFHDNVSVLKHEQISSILTEIGFSCNLRWDGKSPFGYLFATKN